MSVCNHGISRGCKACVLEPPDYFIQVHKTRKRLPKKVKYLVRWAVLQKTLAGDFSRIVKIYSNHKNAIEYAMRFKKMRWVQRIKIKIVAKKQGAKR